MLKTYEVKDVTLQQRQKKCVGDKDEITGNMTEYKLKLNMKLDDLQIWNDKIAALSTELHIVLPERYVLYFIIEHSIELCEFYVTE